MSFYDDASWLLIPSGIKEDVVYAQKPTSGLGDLTFTRASDATYTDSTGVVRRSPYNLVTFSEMFTDASWVKIGASISANTTIAPNGTLTADTLIESATSGDHKAYRVIPLIQNNSYTFSVYAKKKERNLIYIYDAYTARGSIFNLDTSAISNIGLGLTSPSIVSVGDGWYRCSGRINASSNTSFEIGVTNSTSGISYTGDGTSGIFIWGAQLVEGSSALDYFPTTNRQDVPRIDFRNADGTLSSCGRLLLEPQRTNSIRNSSMVGAVAGSPGALPTNWATVTGGLSQTIIGTGTENGLPYIDLRFNGTASAAEVLVANEFGTLIAATSGQTWSSAIYAKTIAAPTAPNTTNLRVAEITTLGVIVVRQLTPVTLTSTLQRFTSTRTLNGGATVAFVNGGLVFELTIGQTYDFTIRIAAPQMELGAYATTWVPTTTAAVTRLADTASKTGVSSLIGQTEGTFYAEVNMTTVQNSIRNIFTIYQDQSNFTRFRVTATGSMSIETFYGGSFAAQLTSGTVLNGNNKLAFSYKNGEGTRLFLNGSLVNTTVVVTTNIAGSEIKLGIDNFNGNQFANGIAQAALFPTRLQNAQLAQLTTL